MKGVTAGVEPWTSFCFKQIIDNCVAILLDLFRGSDRGDGRVERIDAYIVHDLSTISVEIVNCRILRDLRSSLLLFLLLAILFRLFVAEVLRFREI